MVILFSILILILIIIWRIAKVGREKTLSLVIKFLSPICIIVFYLSNSSIIIFIFDLFKISNDTILKNPSIRVAIDSSIVTLIINIVVEFFNNPIDIKIETRTPSDMEQVRTYIDRHVHVNCSISINFKKVWIKKLYKKHGNIILGINNSKHTSLAIDKIEQYRDCINSENASKKIEINLNKISDSDETVEKIYFTLAILSGSSVKWDDYITYDIEVKSKILNKTKRLFIQIVQKSINVIFRED